MCFCSAAVVFSVGIVALDSTDSVVAVVVVASVVADAVVNGTTSNVFIVVVVVVVLVRGSKFLPVHQLKLLKQIKHWEYKNASFNHENKMMLQKINKGKICPI